MATGNLTEGEAQTKTILEELGLSRYLVREFHQESFFFSAVHILLSITAFLGNTLILVALHKESSLHPPSKLLYCCLATTDLLVGLVNQPLYATFLISCTLRNWSVFRFTYDGVYITSHVLCGVSLFSLTAISVDRLLALLLGLRYKRIVTLKRIYAILALFWVASLVSTPFYILNHRISTWYSSIAVSSCLVISIASYKKIFCALRHHQAQVQDHVQQQPGQPNALNMARYRKAVHSALWVQLALVFCYFPYFTVAIVISESSPYPPYLLVVIREIAVVLVYFNSTLNPFLYCWKISEVRKAVKRTIRQALCCPWT